MFFSQLERLLAILHRLRGENGCPWDRKQTLATAARYLADEVHEYADAAAAGQLEEASGELADLLYMVCFNWLLLREQVAVELDELAGRGADKLVRRHPHVFGSEQARTAEDSQVLWNRIKAQERQEHAERAGTAERGDPPPHPSVLKELAASTSPLRQAFAYGSSAAEVGFDWAGPEGALVQLRSELAELLEAHQAGTPASAAAELGDLLFAVVQLGRKLGMDPDAALRASNRRFARRFQAVEARYEHDPARLRAAGASALASAWQAVKAQEPASAEDAARPGQRPVD